ncbi:integrase, catalytic region, zinc finger, CCHC-type containing protein [Tanacetum coccineum]
MLQNHHECPILPSTTTRMQRFVTLVKQSQELKTVSYHKLYDILKQHQNEVNEIRTERLAHLLRLLKDEEMSKEEDNLDKFLCFNLLSGTGYDNQRAVKIAELEYEELRCAEVLRFSVITARNMGMYQGTITIKRISNIEGRNPQFYSPLTICDANLEVAFRKSTCYIRDLKGNDLLTGSRGTDLYSISQAWLWHRRLSHLNFDTINLLSKNNIVNGLPKLKFVKDHLTKHLSLIDFLTLVPKQAFCAQVTTVRTDKGTKFLNKTLHAYFAKEGIRHETSTARTPEQNGVVERRNRTLVEAARTMLSAAKVPLFFWAEAIATTCFTQNRSLVIPRHEKTPYHIINARKPSVKFFHIFGSLCYIVRDGENLDKMKEKGIQIHQSPRGIFINQAKYAQEILKKHGMTSCDSIGTPMATKHLDADLSGTPVDQTKYHSMVRALMYLTTSIPDIVHGTCYCARYQAKPTEKHLTVVKRTFRYLKDSINMGLWYPKDTGFELTAFLDSNHAGYLDSRKSTSGGI